jgi:tetratricopeptide (TPR) repeat protein
VSSLPEHRELWFAHGLTREVAYRSLPRAERCLAHAAVARWLEGLAGDRREEFVELLAHHLEAAVAPGDARLAWPEGSPEELRAKAVRALVQAGDAARRRHSSEQALRFAARALALAASPAERLAAVELRARSYAAVVRVDEALESFEEAHELARAAGDAAARARLRTAALLMSVRYMGAFASEDWLDRVEALAAHGLAETRQDDLTVEVGAQLLWRSWGGDRRREREQRAETPADVGQAKRDAVRAIEIAEAVGSSVLFAVALEGLTWITFKEGLADAAELGERHLRAAATLADHVEAHESFTTAAICFANAGRFATARRATIDAIAQAARLSPHRMLHAAAAGSMALVPTGRFAEFLDGTPGLEELAAAEGERLCATGTMGLAGRCLALHETGDPSAERAFEVLRAAAPPTRWLGWGHPLTELLRPAVSPDETRERLRSSGRPLEAWLVVRRLRTELALHAIAGDWDLLRDAMVQARALAASVGAPALAWHADWAAAVRLLADGRAEEALALAETATAALAGYGERYTAGRLMAELLALMGGEAPEELVASTADGLEAMGAHASAALARDGEAQAVSR